MKRVSRRVAVPTVQKEVKHVQASRSRHLGRRSRTQTQTQTRPGSFSQRSYPTSRPGRSSFSWEPGPPEGNPRPRSSCRARRGARSPDPPRRWADVDGVKSSYVGTREFGFSEEVFLLQHDRVLEADVGQRPVHHHQVGVVDVCAALKQAEHSAAMQL